MAIRKCFIASLTEAYKEIEVDFTFYNGFAISQKQKSIKSLHENIMNMDPNLKLLEVSTKSINPDGVALSAFNLKFIDQESGAKYPLENVFQSSKVFEFGGPYTDLLCVDPRDAKRDERLKTSGKLKYFQYKNNIWELEPKTMFYDWIYVQSLYKDSELAKRAIGYNAFTDIEFNHEKSINCQARSAAIFVSLIKQQALEIALSSKVSFGEIYKGRNSKIQTSFFDL